jgi:UDP-GlcNAc:undecaprenyl-phosphate GlcNAc-1-phosphate transferase
MSHRLAALGLSDRGVAFLLYGVAIALAGIGIAAESIRTLVLPVVALAAIGLVLFAIFLHEVDVYGTRSAIPRGEDDVTGLRGRLLKQSWLISRFGAEIGLDAVLLTIAYFTAYLIRFEGVSEAVWLGLFTASVAIVVGGQLAALVVLGVYRTLWRYLGVSDALAIIRAAVVGTGLGAVGVLLVFRFTGYSRAVFALDCILAAALLITARSFLLWLRHWFSRRPQADAVRVLIVGATERGAFALRLLTSSTQTAYRPVGFVDDDPGKRYRRVSGVPILGTTAEIESAITRSRAELVVLALGPDEQETARRVQAACASQGVELREFLVPI